MRIIKPSKRPRNGQLSSQAATQQDALDFVALLSDEPSASSFDSKPFESNDSGQALSHHGSIDEPVDPGKKSFNDLFAKGVRLLAMREHSIKEITDKLKAKTDAMDIVYAVVDELIDNKYLSNERFTEAYVRSRGNRGFGPVKIRSELKGKGIGSSMIDDYLDASAAIWYDNAASQYHKKYGDAPVSDYNAWSKRARFMQSRGFTMEHIQLTLPKVDFD